MLDVLRISVADEEESMFGKSVIYISGRIVKVLANLLKILCYIFHFIFPKARFTLPEYSKPLISSKKESKVPRILWQTNFTDKVTLPVYLNYLFNRLMSPTFEYRFMITEAREAFIRENYSAEILNSYLRLQIGASQADFWRVLVLNKIGGVYLDIDANLIWPLGVTVPSDVTEMFLISKKGRYSNYFIASQPDSVHLKRIVELIMKNIEENTIKSVHKLTGPGALNSVVEGQDVHSKNYKYICGQGDFTNEYFQYIDKAEGKWTKAQRTKDLIK